MQLLLIAEFYLNSRKKTVLAKCFTPRKECESNVTLGASLRRYERCSGSSGIISTPTATSQASVTTRTRPGWSKTIPSQSTVGIPAAVQFITIDRHYRLIQ